MVGLAFETDEIRLSPGIKSVTPGKCRSKKAGRLEGLLSNSPNCLLGRKRVQVNDPS